MPHLRLAMRCQRFSGFANSLRPALAGQGASPADRHRIVGVYVGRILDAEKPANLPVQQATKVELITNLRAAKTLGPNIPLPLPGRADLAKANRPNEYDAQRQLRPKYRTPLLV